MLYAIYKNARNSSWQCLIDCKIHELPIKPVQIATHYGIRCKRLEKDENSLNQKSGEIRIINNEVYMFVDASQSIGRQRFTVMHELGHYLLGHLGNTLLSQSYSNIRPEEEQAADRFATDMLMPACVLWGLNIHTPNDIANLCNVSMQAAQIRARRMEELYRRNMFLSHPLERQVFQQFQQFINAKKRG